MSLSFQTSHINPWSHCFYDVKCRSNFYLLLPAKAHHGWAQRADEEHQASLPGRAALLLPDYWQALLRPRLRQRRRGESRPHNSRKSEPESGQKNIKVRSELLLTDVCLFFSPAVLPSAEREDLPGAQSQVLRRRNCKCTWLPPLPAHRVQVMSRPTVPPSGLVLTWSMLNWTGGGREAFF